MRYQWTLGTIVLAAALLGACSSSMPVDELRRNTLIFGGLNMDDAPSGAHTVSLKIVRGDDIGSFFNIPVKKDVFYHEGLPKGSYQLYRIYGQSGLNLGICYLFGSPYAYHFGAQAEGFRVTQERGVLYAGSYKIAKEGGFFSSKFSISVDKSRTQRQVLEALLPKLDDPVVKAKAEAYLKTLK